jgi:endonuclease III
MKGQRDGPGREDGDVDDDRQPMQTGELERGEVSGGRGLGAESGCVRLWQEDLAGVDGAGERDHEERDCTPTERTWLPEPEDQSEEHGDSDGDQPEPVVSGEDAFHHPHRDSPVDDTEGRGRHQEGEEDLHPEPCSEEGRDQALEDPHLIRMIRVGEAGVKARGLAPWEEASRSARGPDPAAARVAAGAGLGVPSPAMRRPRSPARSSRRPPWLAAALRAPMSAREIGAVIRTLQRRAPSWRPTAVAEVAAEQPDPFRVLIACLLSLRTQDATTREASERLFRVADTPSAMLRLPASRVARLIFPVGFYRTKARAIRAICRDLIERFDGRVPDDLDLLLTLHGVGRKTANLVVTVGFGKPGICVDIHVHRISNRLGFVRTKTPDQTEAALRAKLPRRHWIGYNDLLVAFGQNVCRPVSPHCTRCPVARWCHRVGVSHAR